MRRFSFAHFATLLIRVLEISVVAAIVARWAALALIVRADTNKLGGTVIDVAANFCLLGVLLLLAGDLWLFLSRRPHAISTTFRTLLYLVLSLVGPYRLGGQPGDASRKPNQALELTASRRYNQISMTSTFYSPATHALARSSSASSR